MLQARKDYAVKPQHDTYRSEERHAYTAAPGKRVKNAVTLLIFSACFLLGLVVVAQYSQIVALNYSISRSQVNTGTLVEEYRELEIEAARLGSLSRIDNYARSELGMREPATSQLRVLTAAREDHGAPVRE